MTVSALANLDTRAGSDTRVLFRTRDDSDSVTILAHMPILTRACFSTRVLILRKETEKQPGSPGRVRVAEPWAPPWTELRTVHVITWEELMILNTRYSQRKRLDSELKTAAAKC